MAKNPLEKNFAFISSFVATKEALSPALEYLYWHEGFLYATDKFTLARLEFSSDWTGYDMREGFYRAFGDQLVRQELPEGTVYPLKQIKDLFDTDRTHHYKPEKTRSGFICQLLLEANYMLSDFCINKIFSGATNKRSFACNPKLDNMDLVCVSRPTELNYQSRNQGPVYLKGRVDSSLAIDIEILMQSLKETGRK